jgi:hypothetical protein
MDLIVDFPQHRGSSAFHNRASSRRASSQRNRAVSFQEQVDMKFIKNLSCSKHRDDIWFSSDEMHSFRYQAARTVRAITSTMTMAQYAEFHVEDTSAFMGLESYLTKDALLGIAHRKEAIRVAVLSEQRRQYHSGINDPDALARVSQDVSDLSTKRAQIIGMIHAEKR